MNIKISAVSGIPLKRQLHIIADYIGKDQEPKQTDRITGTKIESSGKKYHVSCKKTKTLWSFKIWWAV